MIEPLSQRTSPYSENADLGSPGLPMAPPPPPPRSGLRSLRVLPSPEAPQESETGPSKQQAGGALQLRSELEAARNELNALQDMLEELPAILERKFQQRLRGLLDQQRVLIARNPPPCPRVPHRGWWSASAAPYRRPWAFPARSEPGESLPHRPRTASLMVCGVGPTRDAPADPTRR
jgi:hypothetical protein